MPLFFWYLVKPVLVLILPVTVHCQRSDLIRSKPSFMALRNKGSCLLCVMFDFDRIEACSGLFFQYSWFTLPWRNSGSHPYPKRNSFLFRQLCPYGVPISDQ